MESYRENSARLESNTVMKSKIKQSIVMAILIAALFGVAIVSLCMGQYEVSSSNVISIILSNFFPVNGDWSDTMYRVIMYNRFPRIIAAVAVGSALSLAGAAYQGVFRNPLVSPDLLGVSHGACVGAAISIILGLGYIGNVVLAFFGGLIAVAITVLFPTLINKKSTIALVLSGVIVGGFFSSILGLLKYIADPDTELAEITYWQLGSLAKIKNESLYVILPIMIISGLVIYLLRWRINVISLGESESKALGVNLQKERGIIILCSTMLTASAICISGTIGWIGLTMPHLARLLVGQDNMNVIPVSALISAIFLIIVDTAARNLTGAEIPLSIITGFIGTPFFAFVLVKQKHSI